MTTIQLASLFSMSNDILISFGAGVFIAVSLGFTAGYFFGKSAPARNLRRAKKHLRNCFQHVKETLDTAQTACALLEKFPGMLLTKEQSNELNKKRSNLLDLITRVVERKSSDQEQITLEKNRAKRNHRHFRQCNGFSNQNKYI